MTLLTDIEDTSKSLHSDGNWHLMAKGVWQNKWLEFDYPHGSVIYHQCRNYWNMQGDDHIFVPPVQYRISVAELNIPCSHCGEVCPEALQGLWKLHNYNSIQSAASQSSIP